MVVSGVGGIVGIFTAGLYANFGHVLVSNDEKNTKSVYSQFEVFFHIVNTIVYSLTMMLIIPFVRVYTRGITDVEYIRVFFAILIVTNGFLYNMKTPQGTMIMASGHFKETRVQTTIQGLIAVVGGIIGAVFFGLEGLMVGILLSNLYRIVDVIIYVPKRIIPVGYWKSIKRALISLCLYVFFTIFAFIISKDIYSYFSWFKTAIFYAIMISTIVIVIYSMLEPKETKLIYKRILSIFERRE